MTELKFVLEIGVEEMPSRFLESVSEDLRARMQAELETQRLAVADLHSACSPRRLVVSGKVRARQIASEVVTRGPRVESAFRDGQPTLALEGFLRKVGMAADQLTEEENGGKAYVVARTVLAAEPAERLLPGAVSTAFEGLNLPRSMRWGSGRHRFVRPLRWVGLWLEDQALDVTLAGVRSTSVSYGNRTDHPEAVTIRSASSHAQQLVEDLQVMVDSSARRKTILDEGCQLAAEVGGVMDEEPTLLDEVVALVEWPVAFRGSFEPRFLDVPHPVLITTMKTHQRYFPVMDAEGGLLPYFIGVRNGIGETMDTVRAGNEKVLRARLQDAEYFYRQDLKQRLEERAPRLSRVVFHARLGTYQDKIERLRKLFRATASFWQLSASESDALARAIDLSKCDLLTHMVEEFPELEGVMGGIYARHEGESAIVADALSDQYLPRWQGDRIPRSRVGAVLGVLDRTDTLVMAYAHGIAVTGSEDPFGLRRAALGIARIWTESQIAPQLGLSRWMQEARRVYDLDDKAETSEARDLILGRLKGYWSTEGIALEVIDAVCAVDDRLSGLRLRVAELRAMIETERWPNYLAAYRRIDRVLTSRIHEALEANYAISEEQRVADAIIALQQADTVDGWWARMEAAPAAVQAFFEELLVMDPDEHVRHRRMVLLTALIEQLERFWNPVRLQGMNV